MAGLPQEIIVNDPKATGTLAGALNSTDTVSSLSLQAGQGSLFPALAANQQHRVIVDDEVMLATARTGDVITVTRGQEGTTKTTHAIGATVDCVLTAAAVNRFTPDYVRHPRQNNIKAWNFDPQTMGNAVTPAAGVMYCSLVFIPEDMPIANVHWFLSVVGVANANNYFAVWNSAGTRLGVTADQSVTNQSGAGLPKSATLTVDAGQSLSLSGGPGVYVVVGALLGTVGTTAVQYRSGSGSANLGRAAADPYLCFSKGSALSAVPTAVQDFTAGTAIVPPIAVGLS